MFRIFLLLIGLMVSVLWPASVSAGTPTQWTELIVETASYRVKVRVGPPVTMPMSSMTTIDHGRRVNHHVEVHIFDKKTGTELKTLTPEVALTNESTRTAWRLTNIMACLISRHRETEPHFGDNLYLPDGTYTIAVAIGRETAVFRTVRVTAAG